MPFTQVTLVNDSDSEADAEIHINPVGGGEAWIPLVVLPKQVGIEPNVPPQIDIIHGNLPTRKGRPTRVDLQGGMHAGMRILPNDIVVQPPEEIQSVTILVHLDGQAVLHANILDMKVGSMRTESRILVAV